MIPIAVTGLICQRPWPAVRMCYQLRVGGTVCLIGELRSKSGDIDFVSVAFVPLPPSMSKHLVFAAALCALVSAQVRC